MDKIPNHAVYYWLMGGKGIYIHYRIHHQLTPFIVKRLRTNSQTSNMIAHFHLPTHHLSATTRLRSFVANQTPVHHRTVPQISAQENVPLSQDSRTKLHGSTIWESRVLRIPAGSVRCGTLWRDAVMCSRGIAMELLGKKDLC
jgi:hypothetical protein